MKTIVVVEDNTAIREDIAEMLELAGYKALTAENGKEGAILARSSQPDLIISDIMMPVVDGLGMLHILRKDPETESIPFIFLTSKTDRHDFRNAMESGADDYITKPFNTDELLKAIENRFKRQSALNKRNGVPVPENGTNSASEESLDTLFKDSDTRLYQKKEKIYKEGATSRYLYYILKGKARTYKSHEIGKDLALDLYAAGDLLGYTALLEDGIYKETAEVIENNTEVAMVPRNDFEALLHRNPAVGQKLANVLAKNVAEKEQQLVNIAYNTLRQKVASVLVNLQKKFHNTETGGYAIDLSRDELASMAGTAKESFIRTLTDFKNEKLVNVKKDSTIEIINTTKLEKIAS